MNKSESIKELNIALNKFQQKVNNPKNTDTNAFFKSKYAPLDIIINSVKPTLTECGLAVFQNVSGDGEKINVSTMITHISGEWIESDTLTLNNSDNKGVSLAQAAGISITYARRYQLSAILGISSEDDTDGNNYNQQNTDKPNVDHGKITDGQITRLYAIAYSKGVTREKVNSSIKQKLNITDLSTLTKEQYETICTGYENMKKGN